MAQQSCRALDYRTQTPLSRVIAVTQDVREETTGADDLGRAAQQSVFGIASIASLAHAHGEVFC
jgi:hypothetical protein